MAQGLNDLPKNTEIGNASVGVSQRLGFEALLLFSLWYTDKIWNRWYHIDYFKEWGLPVQNPTTV